MKHPCYHKNRSLTYTQQCTETVILRDHYNKVEDAIAIPIGKSTSHKAKPMTALFNMRMDVESGFQNLWLEGDSLNIINMLNNKSLITWSIEGSLMEIKDLMTKFDNVFISHIFHEDNKAADWTANQVAYWETKLRWQDDLSKEIELMAIVNYEKRHAIEKKITQD